jgi:hypothetical protein
MGFLTSIKIFFLKVLFFKKGASIIFSFASSYVLTLSAKGLFDILVKDAEVKKLLLPFILQLFHMGIFSFLVGLDYRIGKRVSIQVRKEPFDPDRLRDTSVKYLATGIFTFMIMGMSICGEIMDSYTIWFTALLFQNGFWIMSSGFEYSSIGRHYETLRGKKPNMFQYFDKVFGFIQLNILSKFDKSIPEFKKEEIEKKEDNEN